MICQKCGNEIDEGKLICEKCGSDVQLIPSFEPEIEREISDALSNPYVDDDEEEAYYEDDQAYYDDELIDEAEPEYYDDAEYNDDEAAYYEDEAIYDEEYRDEDYNDYEEQEFDEEYDGELLDELDDLEDDEGNVLRQIALAIRQSRFRPVYMILGGILVIAIIVSIIYIAGVVVHDNSSEYQAKMGMEAFDTGNYEAAITYMDRAHTLDSSNADITYKLAECYLAAGEDENALGMLWELGTTQAYQLILGYYIKNEDFDQAKLILENCEDENIKLQYQSYMANPPAFSEPEGSYTEKVTLKISSNTNGTIYYTMDGTEPNKYSNIYTTPLSLERGVYEIRAVFVNEYGMRSDEVYGKYSINLNVPDMPYVMPAGGMFLKPELINVKVPEGCTVYYTTDGTEPDATSQEYTGPVPMLLGSAHMIFVAISEDGIAGPTAEREYNLNIASLVDLNTIPLLMAQYNITTGKTIDPQGHDSKNNTQRYTYSINSAIALGDGIYFIVTENTVDKEDVSMKTGSYYLVDVYTSAIFKANVNEDDQSISLGDMLPPESYMTPIEIMP